ncbi:acyl-ACP--UDP-N-acetylglucosamine O-acyltransferase [Caulobacter sp. UNC279MFTsu5.1]|uniref:acyl-ACP--UDP-N-acetylglucosamine O-acyltransferase n=1 Tax=Caulobacter sp. UNC279MFTsu5.1 TaxID=1502775 RepID=UPI0008E8A7FD|nr:acyl-ACP--UDP-N-acetylglucosamine O-acyltransferase [Caulobacter sp. UNC279MFTsu5.1]SFK11789.1 acyl-[acyl-carrier-protein]--UDP-N-acetylglucosamine O-acyltransferase [Caulobacter sp. UNC279MFTsu5.1]
MTQIHPTAIVSPGAQLGQDVEIGPFCTVGPQVQLGDGVRLVSHAVIEGATQVGAGTTVHPFAVLGGAPQHLAHKGEDTRLVIGERNIIREHVTMHAGTVGGGGVTKVGSDSLYMVGAHVAHDCIVGDRVTFANNATLGGHVVIGDFVFMGGLCAVHQFTRIGRYSFVGGGGVVTKDIIPYGSVWGNHAHLEGLNLVGLKRRGFSREAINALRAAYRLLFADEGTFQERLDDVAEAHAGTPEVMEIVEFIRSEANRPLCLPEREV